MRVRVGLTGPVDSVTGVSFTMTCDSSALRVESLTDLVTGAADYRVPAVDAVVAARFYRTSGAE